MSIDNNIDFKDHIVQYPNRFKQTTVAPGIVELVPTWIETPEQIIQPGTPVDSELFKKLKENVTCYSQTYTATEGQTVFPVTHPYNVGQSRISVYVGGVKQRTILDFTEASSTSFVLNVGLRAGTKVEAVTISFVQPLSSDVQQQIDSFLEQSEFNANRINSFSKSLSEKADKDYVDKITKSLASGSPKGIYNTLLDLQNAKPQGDTNIYVIASSGEWYFWSGAAWISGGAYQAPLLGDASITNTKLAQETVSPDKTTFFKPFSNMFDKTKISQGFDILSSTGELVANPSYFASDFIPVVPGRVYKLKNFGGGSEFVNFGFYTQAKTFVKRIQEYLPFTIPDGVYFIRFSTNENKDVITFSLNSSVSLSYTPYAKTSLELDYLKDITGEQLKNEAITPEKTVFFGESYNLFNSSTAFAGFDLSASTGQPMAAEGYFSSDYIAITPNAVYKLRNFLSQNEYSSFAFYTQNKTFIQRIQEWRTFTAPPNAYYMRFASTENKNGITVSLASNIPVQYVPYNTRKIKPDLLPLVADNRFKVLKWNSLGDSITEANKYQTFVNQKLDFNTVRNYGIGGTCLAVKADESNLTTAFVRRYTAMDNDADVITVMGGTNDFGLNIPLGNENVKDEKTVLGAMAIIIEGLIAKYPGKYIIWATLPQRNNGFETDGKNNNGETTADFAEGIKRTCRKYAIPCIDIHNESGINKFNMNTNGSLMPDKVHPSDAGYKRLASLFIYVLQKIIY